MGYPRKVQLSNKKPRTGRVRALNNPNRDNQGRFQRREVVHRAAARRLVQLYATQGTPIKPRPGAASTSNSAARKASITSASPAKADKRKRRTVKLLPQAPPTLRLLEAAAAEVKRSWYHRDIGPALSQALSEMVAEARAGNAEPVQVAASKVDRRSVSIGKHEGWKALVARVKQARKTLNSALPLRLPSRGPRPGSYRSLGLTFGVSHTTVMRWVKGDKLKTLNLDRTKQKDPRGGHNKAVPSENEAVLSRVVRVRSEKGEYTTQGHVAEAAAVLSIVTGDSKANATNASAEPGMLAPKTLSSQPTIARLLQRLRIKRKRAQLKKKAQFRLTFEAEGEHALNNINRFSQSQAIVIDQVNLQPTAAPAATQTHAGEAAGLEGQVRGGQGATIVCAIHADR